MFVGNFRRNMISIRRILQKILAFSKPIYFTLLVIGFSLYNSAQAANIVTAARVWPAQDYTRITLESNQPFIYKMSVIKNPDRVVIDVENIELNQIIRSLSDKVLASDPYIKQIRVARFQQNVVRLVFDLKLEAKPNSFKLTPTGEYKHRLVLDVYPLKDPLMAMVEERDTASNATASQPQESSNQSNIAIDDGSTNNSTKPQVFVETLPNNSSEVVESTKTVESKPNDFKPTEVKPTKAAEIIKPIEPASEKPEIKNQDAAQVAAQTKPKKNSFNNSDTNKDSRQIVIAIDAGHGGEDPGARGANGSHEKDVTLMIAKKLKEQIDNEPNMRGVLTRDSDFFIPLHGRVVKARNMQADLFVSIHADAFTNQSAKGSSVFALSERGATSASARYLAKKENESDLIGGVSLDDKDPVLARTLLDLSQTATINDSLKLGKAVLTQIGTINTLHTSRVEQAAFAVLKSPDIPSILVETAFISNPEEERRLNDVDYQDKLVTSILAGIKKYFSTNPALAKTKVALE
jgi:N-acetylmuramoyl-L-alanine amidase